MSLQAYYKMNTGWTDASGNGYDGTPNGAIINTVDQKLGAGCGECDGLNDIVTFLTYFDPGGLAKVSIDGWMYRTAATVGVGGVCGWINAGGSNFFFVQSDSTGILRFRAGGAADFGSIAVSQLNTWVYYAMVFDGTLSGNANRLKVYIDSIQKILTFNGTIPAVLPVFGVSPAIGAYGSVAPIRYFGGREDDLAVYNHALTQAEIDYRWNGGTGREISSGSNVRKRKLMEMYNA